MPNFSEGRNIEIIEKIASTIRGNRSIRLLNIDPGEATNRTVMTFVGEAEAVVEVAFEAIKRASELIDMRHQKGTHPRLGATDVLPLIPISGITLEECATLAQELAARVASELMIPTYCYEAAALREERKNLAICRRGEYEALRRRVLDPDDAPDFGARPFDEVIARSGATNIGARNFLIAVNFNLNTDSTAVAKDIALEVRTKGRIVRDSQGGESKIEGKLKACKAIGWYIEEYGIAQVSVNLTNIEITPLHEAFDAISQAASKRGYRVTGTEIIGLIPRRALVEAGRHYRSVEGLPQEIQEIELIHTAIDAMGLNFRRPFIPSERILEEFIEG